jgi:type I restriction enzyme S subunit
MATKTNKKANVPNLRFPEFEEDWKIVKFSEVGVFFKGSGISKEQLSDDGNPCILYGELYTKYKKEVIREVVSKTNLLTKGLVKSQFNDIIIPSSGESAEDIATACCVNVRDVLLGGDLNIIRPHKDNGNFISYQLNGKRKYEIAKIAQGSSVVHLYNEGLKKLNISLPQNVDEQNKIAALLSFMDDRIETQNKIIEKLETLIKGLGESLLQHKLQFSDFKKEWQYQLIEDNCEIRMCKRIFTSETKEAGEIPFYKIGTLGASPDAFISRTLFEQYRDRYNYPKKGEVLVTCSGTVGKCLQYDGEDSYYQDSNIVWIDNPSLKVSNEFLFFVISNINWSKLNSTTITRIYGDDLRKLPINYPLDQREQFKITDTLSLIDKKIRLERKLLNQYFTQKKLMLKNLFI